ncbi:MAG: hypothetical protein ACOVQT_05105, partial [Rubrivivax sp.]
MNVAPASSPLPVAPLAGLPLAGAPPAGAPAALPGFASLLAALAGAGAPAPPAQLLQPAAPA